MIELHIMGGVHQDVAFAAKLFAHLVRDVVAIEHKIRVWVVNAPAVACRGGYGFGVFHAVPGGRPLVYVAGNLSSLVENGDMPATEVVDCVCESFAHELAHYEQWRDDRELTERGVAVRARGIKRAVDQHPLAVAIGEHYGRRAA